MIRREGFERLEKEILGEKAAALGRAGERLEEALAMTSELGHALDRETDPARRATLLAEYEAARRRRGERPPDAADPARGDRPAPPPHGRSEVPRAAPARLTPRMIWNAEAETQAPAARAALQAERLRATVAWAVERVPFHRERLGGVSVRGLEDLPALPFTRKSDLREHYPFGLFAVPHGELARIHASSGTKGKPTVVGYTAGDLAVWREAMARVMVAAGARPGDMLHVAFGYGLFTGGLGFHDGAERIGMTVVPVSSGNTARHHLLLQDFRPPGICGTPSFVLHIAESLAEQGGDPRALGLRYGMFGAEPWTEGLRDRARARLRPARLRHVRPQRDRRPRRGRRVRAARRPARLRRSLPAGDHRPGHRHAARRPGRKGSSC